MCLLYPISSFLNFFPYRDFSPFQKFLIREDTDGSEVSYYTINMNAKSALYAQECQFSIVGLVTGSVMNIINISVAVPSPSLCAHQ